MDVLPTTSLDEEHELNKTPSLTVMDVITLITKSYRELEATKTTIYSSSAAFIFTTVGTSTTGIPFVTNSTIKAVPTTAHAPATGIEDVILVFIAGSVPSLVILCLLCFLIYTKLTAWREQRKIRGNNNINAKRNGSRPNNTLSSTTVNTTSQQNTHIYKSTRSSRPCGMDAHASTRTIKSKEFDEISESPQDKNPTDQLELETLASQEKLRNKLRMRHRLNELDSADGSLPPPDFTQHENPATNLRVDLVRTTSNCPQRTSEVSELSLASPGVTMETTAEENSQHVVHLFINPSKDKTWETNEKD